MFLLGSEHERLAPFASKWIYYTPQLARHILALHNTNNRRMKPAKVRKMVLAMRRGQFLTTHQGIAFAEDGTLLDGQNRLEAIAQSGQAQLFLTVFGLPRRCQAEMDRGTPRDQAESLRFGFGHEADRRMVAVANAMVDMGNRVDLLTAELDEFITVHHPAILFAIGCFANNAKGIRSPILACMARAYYRVEPEVLREFARIVKGGHFAAEEEAAATFGRQIASDGSRSDLSGANGYAMAQRALVYFVHRKPIRQIKPLYGNYFPLPGQQGDTLPREMLAGRS